jgi:hypothetical protein
MHSYENLFTHLQLTKKFWNFYNDKTSLRATSFLPNTVLRLHTS